MASRSLGELMLRPSSLTRIPHAQIPRQTTTPWPCQRSFQSLNRLAQPKREDEKNEHYVSERESKRPQARYVPESEAAQPQPRRKAQPSQAEATQAIDSLFSGMPTSQTPPPYMARNAAQKNSGDRIFGSEFSNTSRARPRGERGAPGLDFNSMAMPDSMLNPNLSNKPSDAANLAIQQEKTFSSYPRLNPTYGRTVELDASRGRDIVRGIGMLGSLMARNKVKSDFNKQRFHERGGLKRKRLASERWRARFKLGFRDITGRVTELTKKGW
ncbi:ribosomal protein s21 protein [Stemphylium lycopersici]|uniref:Ribosomal protein s21 protein n=1 Tax=Stemphylium lycopersici TaxID=183478 RepID=A0A364NBV8_STELY|nr:ribosomal protein s21 protein [Stemphylium lycopersici]RAR14844.1 ribosomal protein s21 protein [Stemphylium lycopersici]